MESKEAIEKLKGFHDYLLKCYPGLPINLSMHREDTEKVIELIEELGKYKEMWNEIATMYKLPCYGLEDSKTLMAIKYIEQKYFPKPIKTNAIHIKMTGKIDDFDEIYRKVNSIEEYLRKNKMGFTLEWE